MSKEEHFWYPFRNQVRKRNAETEDSLEPRRDTMHVTKDKDSYTLIFEERSTASKDKDTHVQNSMG